MRAGKCMDTRSSHARLSCESKCYMFLCKAQRRGLFFNQGLANQHLSPQSTRRDMASSDHFPFESVYHMSLTLSSSIFLTGRDNTGTSATLALVQKNSNRNPEKTSHINASKQSINPSTTHSYHVSALIAFTTI